jgi:hypothetical protein
VLDPSFHLRRAAHALRFADYQVDSQFLSTLKAPSDSHGSLCLSSRQRRKGECQQDQNQSGSHYDQKYADQDRIFKKQGSLHRGRPKHRSRNRRRCCIGWAARHVLNGHIPVEPNCLGLDQASGCLRCSRYTRMLMFAVNVPPRGDRPRALGVTLVGRSHNICTRTVCMLPLQMGPGRL